MLPVLKEVGVVDPGFLSALTGEYTLQRDFQATPATMTDDNAGTISQLPVMLQHRRHYFWLLYGNHDWSQTRSSTYVKDLTMKSSKIT